MKCSLSSITLLLYVKTTFLLNYIYININIYFSIIRFKYLIQFINVQKKEKENKNYILKPIELIR